MAFAIRTMEADLAAGPMCNLYLNLNQYIDIFLKYILENMTRLFLFKQQN